MGSALLGPGFEVLAAQFTTKLDFINLMKSNGFPGFGIGVLSFLERFGDALGDAR